MWMAKIALAGAGSVLVHEYAHVLAAHMCGWTWRGWRFRLPVAVGVVFEANGRLEDRWIVSLWGLAASALLAVGGLYLGGELGVWLVLVNGLLLGVNALPFPGSDGWWVCQHASNRVLLACQHAGNRYMLAKWLWKMTRRSR